MLDHLAAPPDERPALKISKHSITFICIGRNMTVANRPKRYQGIANTNVQLFLNGFWFNGRIAATTTICSLNCRTWGYRTETALDPKEDACPH